MEALHDLSARFGCPQVKTELDIFEALCQWVKADEPNRRTRLGDLMARCLRLSQLSHCQLTFLLDECDLVAQDKTAIKLLAKASIQYLMGGENTCDTAFGRTITNRPRLCHVVLAHNITKPHRLHHPRKAA